MIVELDLPPPLNQTYRYGQGNYYKTEEAKAWQIKAGWLMKKAWHSKPITGGVVVIIIMGIKRDRDIDSCIKIALDLLQSQRVIMNDKQVMQLLVKKLIGQSEPFLSIQVDQLSE